MIRGVIFPFSLFLTLSDRTRLRSSTQTWPEKVSPLGDADHAEWLRRTAPLSCVMPPWRTLDHLLSSAKYSVAARKAQALARRARATTATAASAASALGLASA